MLKNYLKIATRNLLRTTFFSILNITGLAVGITFAMLIGGYVWGEFQVNRNLRNTDRQYLVQSRWKQENMGLEFTTLAPIGQALKTQYPTLVADSYAFYGVTATVSHAHNHFRESIQIGNSSLLTMYGFALLQGNPRTALTRPNDVVITEAKARKLFGKTDVINQSLTIETPQSGKQEFVITGVLKTLLPNSVTHHLNDEAGVFLSLGAIPYFGGDMTDWGYAYILNYVELQPGVSPEKLQKPLAQLIATHAPPHIQKNLTAYLTPLTAYYLTSNDGLVRRMIGTLAWVAVFILLMAGINFVNLSLGSASSRLREIGVRKALGGRRWQLTAQFLLEALTLTGIATLLSVGLYVLCRPIFGEVVGKPIPSLMDLPGTYIWLVLAMVPAIGLLAGGYPALYLSAYSSVDSLKGKEKSAAGGQWFRRGLVTTQFTIAVLVFVGAIFVSRQISFFFNTDLGFEKEALLTISSLPRNWSPAGVTHMRDARDQLARLPGVGSVSLSFEIPNGSAGLNASVYLPEQDSTQAIAMPALTTDEHFAEAYQVEVLSGKYFNQNSAMQDTAGIVLNEAATRALGYTTPDAAVSKLVRIQGNPQPSRVLGVVRNFHFGSLHKAIEPLVISHVQTVPLYRYFSFKLVSENVRPAMAAIEKKWRELFPDAPFEYAFLDQTLEKLYKTELQLEKAAYVATGLALLVMLLGVVGMVSLTVSRRTKEVGIRKVLGASVAGIVALFLKEYAWILLVANLIAWPLAYALLTDWLADYAYHTSITWVPFVQVGAGLAVVTALVIGLQVVKTALMNPVKSLRSE
jgi:putative ABC transport system permease protein